MNGARKLNGKNNNDPYSAWRVFEDYSITGAAIHVLNGKEREWLMMDYGMFREVTKSKILDYLPEPYLQ